MDLAQFVLNEVLVEGRSVRAVAASHDVSKTWLYELLARYRAEGDAGLIARSRRPHCSPRSVPAAIEAQIVSLRKSLAEEGLDAGPHTILGAAAKPHRAGFDRFFARRTVTSVISPAARRRSPRPDARRRREVGRAAPG
jgi:hypothetical protein